MANRHTAFWLDLLTYGNTEDEKKLNWNYYLFKNYSRSISDVLDDKETQEFKARLPYPRNRDDEIATEQRVNFVLTRYELKVRRSLSRIPDETWMPFPDLFSAYNFPKHISFADRLLIDVVFTKSTFRRSIVFDGAVFLGSTVFDGVKFDKTDPPGDEVSMQNISFSGSLFHGSASFGNIGFPDFTSFEGVSFRGNVNFEGAEFRGPAVFDRADFRSSELSEPTTSEKDVSFQGSIFVNSASFRGTRFPYNSTFEKASFRDRILFDGAEFRGPVAFDETDFGSGPSPMEGSSRPALSFSGSSFRGPSSFRNSKFPHNSTFEKASFERQTVFNGAEFQGSVKFDDADFHAAVVSGEEAATQQLSFFGSEFSGSASFVHTKFPHASTFENASFGSQTIFDGAEFRGSVCFDLVKFNLVKLEQMTINLDQLQPELLPEQEISFLGSAFRGSTTFRSINFPDTSKFSKAEFSGWTCFDGTTFRGLANFDCVDFNSGELTVEDAARHEISFSNSEFFGSVSFKEARFTYLSNFEGAKFHRNASFQGSVFPERSVEEDPSRSPASFRMAKFHMLADFRGAVYGDDVEFDNAELEGKADFGEASFGGSVRFHNCKFRSTTAFRGTKFSRPPYFFETELHEDVDFSGADWTQAERSYRRSNGCDVSGPADDAVRCWDRLALIMSQREKFPERHEFFRLKMRALRQRDGLGLLSFLNWLFEETSDYGWGVKRALLCWAGQCVLGGVVLAVLALRCTWGTTTGLLHVISTLLDGLALSFASSHAFLRLASGDGWLHGSRDAIVDSCGANEIFNYIGLTQAVLGPVLLFLVLLTLRNRFRLG